MLHIADILNSDARYTGKHALPDNLGDRYLYNRNPLFRAIRDTVCELGYRFSKEYTRAWIDYQVFPLLSLQTFVDSHTIPYVDNGTSAAALVERYPNIALEPKFLLDSMKKNYLLHESSHCVSYEFLKDRQVLAHHFSTEQRQQFVIKSLICECFATGVERVACGLADSNSHILFCALNTYVNYDPERHALLSAAIKKLGIRTILRLACIWFFRENYTGDDDKSVIERVARLLSERHSTVLDAASIGELLAKFKLNPNFRDETTPNYFELLGCRKEYEQVKEADFLRQDDPCAAIMEEIDWLLESAFASMPAENPKFAAMVSSPATLVQTA